ncbi:MAG: N-6 DNA methylase [Clostridia bacterium]|nr:N-6 DNA methylase [Clostridia bacterium]
MGTFKFDFTFDKPSVTYIEDFTEEVTEGSAGPSVLSSDGNNLCPFPVPTVKEIIKDINSFSYGTGTGKLLSDLFECGALAISNLVDKTQFDKREERYKEVINGYRKDEQKRLTEIFAKIYALLSSVVYDDGVFADYLGDIYMQCNVSNKNAGQFFTPYHISKFCAKAAMDEATVKHRQAADEILTLNDCCCGSGGMMIAGLDVLAHDYHFNYARNCFIDCADIDIRCVHMAYLQLSLAGVPAVIKHQNSLSRELWSVWYTPALIMQYTRFHRYISFT